MRRMRRELLILGGLLGLPAVGACDRGEPGRVPAPAAADVTVSRPVPAPVVRTLPGTVRSTDEAEVATRTSGTIRRVMAEIGQSVARGDLLAEVDATATAAGLARAEAEAEVAQAYYGRIAALARDGAATPQELDEALSRRDASAAAVRDARGQLAYVELRAPFAGVVSARHADPGDLAVPGTPILSLVRPGSLKVEADVPAEVVDGFRGGGTVTVRVDDKVALPALVTRVSPSVDAGTRRVRIELDFTAEAASLPPPGSYVRLEVEDATRRTLWVPHDVLVRRGQLTGVYRLENGHLRLRWIRAGARRGEAVEILAGAGPEDLLVREPAAELADGVAAGSVTTAEWTP